jgi:phosphonate transport system ATP-binding protein
MIGTSSLTKSYDLGVTFAIENLDLIIRQGEVIALIGKSGSGKSTLLKLISGIELPSDGTIQISDQAVASLRGRSARRKRSSIALIHQGLALVPRLSTLENVLQGALPRLVGPRLGLVSYPAHLKAQARELLDRVGILDKQYEALGNLSGGQMQRVAIARALMQQPEILLADEPISALDPNTASQVLELFKEVALEFSLTVIIAIHQVNFVSQFATRVIGLTSGRKTLDIPSTDFGKKALSSMFGD